MKVYYRKGIYEYLILVVGDRCTDLCKSTGTDKDYWQVLRKEDRFVRGGETPLTIEELLGVISTQELLEVVSPQELLDAIS